MIDVVEHFHNKKKTKWNEIIFTPIIFIITTIMFKVTKKKKSIYRAKELFNYGNEYQKKGFKTFKWKSNYFLFSFESHQNVHMKRDYNLEL